MHFFQLNSGPAIVFQFVEEAVVRNFVKCFLEIEKDGVCLYSIIDIVSHGETGGGTQRTHA